MQRDELAGWLRLALTWEVAGAPARRLLASFGLPSSIFRQDAEALAQVVGAGPAAALREEPRDFAARLEATLAWIEKDPAHRDVLTLADPDYPQALLATEDPPLMLYRLGRLEALPPRG